MKRWTDLADAAAARDVALACAAFPAETAEAEICVGCTPSDESEAEADRAAKSEADKAESVAALYLLSRNVSIESHDAATTGKKRTQTKVRHFQRTTHSTRTPAHHERLPRR